ncbi:MAG: phage integrase SAM-like domain-containing protein [Flavobacteriaceae bacterium]|nr:phage integrase SAM-like domain-containing protein [Flavobacteriaceae bacterium]
MTVSFKVLGKKEFKKFYVRLKDTNENIDITLKTDFSISSENYKKGKIIKSKIPNGATAKDKVKINNLNKRLEELETDLTDLKNLIHNRYNNRKDYEVINKEWLENILHPKTENKNTVPDRLVDFYKYFLKVRTDELAESTIKKHNSILKRLVNFEKETNSITYIQEVDTNFKDRFREWLKSKGYHINTIIMTIKKVVSVCVYAQDNYNKILNPITSRLTKGKGMQYKKTQTVYLNFRELKQIEEAYINNDKLEITRDWLLISCYTAQRVSDFMKFSTKDIVHIKDNKYLDISQNKTGTPVLIYLDEKVLNIIEKYGGNFPPLYSYNSADSNNTIYNKYLKKLGRICGINEIITAEKKNPKTNRNEVYTLPKYHFLTTHIGRRSYATNFYHKGVEASLLRTATGHKSERQFLEYVGTAPKQSAERLAEAMKSIKTETNAQFKVIRNASNGN